MYVFKCYTLSSPQIKNEPFHFELPRSENLPNTSHDIREHSILIVKKERDDKSMYFMPEINEDK